VDGAPEANPFLLPPLSELVGPWDPSVYRAWVYHTLPEWAGTSADVRLDGMLREFAPTSRLRSNAVTVGALLDELEGRFPRLRSKLRDETGALRRYVNVFVDGENVTTRSPLSTSLVGEHTVDILHSIAGG